MLAQEHFLISDLEKAEKDSTKDYHLAMSARAHFTEFFKNQSNEAQWKDRLKTLKGLDLKRSPIFEAILLFGEWKIEKEYKKGIRSAQKFEEMGKIANRKNWFWLLVYCWETTAYIYRSFGYAEELEHISKKILSYLRAKREILPTHIVLKLTRLFNNIIINAERNDIDEVCKVLIDFSGRKLSEDYFHFQRSFLFEAIKIARFLKLETELSELEEKVIQRWIDEAEFKGKASKLIKASLLRQALDYSISVGNKEKTQQLKRDLSTIDFLNELKEVTLPKQELKQFERIFKKHYSKLREVTRKYVEELAKLHPLQILWNICNDDSLIRINLKGTKEFVQELIEKHPVQQIFGTVLHSGEKTIRFESQEDKEGFQLNRQLRFAVNETFFILNQIFSELTDRNLLTTFSIEDFLSHCSCINKKNLELIKFGASHHFQKEYIASISILTPLIENILFDYLRLIGADISSYQGKVIEQRELGGLLNLVEVRSNFGEDFQYFLRLLLVEADSINFRNRFAHGNVEVKEFNESVSFIILFIILKICSKTFKASN